MLKITIEEYAAEWATRSGYAAVIWSRANINYEPENAVFTTARYSTAQEAKERAELAFGLLDWGKGGQPENQAVIGLDY